MKKLLILAGLIFSGLTALAITTNTTENVDTVTSINGYGNSFIFVESDIEFSVFRDGQFDFNILRNKSNVNVAIGTPNINFSFNSGYNYNPYVQYDEYGAIIQIENVIIDYDYYGRIIRAGNINIHYNNFGYVSRVGGLYVNYNRYNVFSHCTGFINTYNRNYIYRPWHDYYRIPSRNYCVVYNRPYRQYYKPVRHFYSKPYYNNYRRSTSVATRRGNTIVGNRSYATVNRGNRSQLKTNTYTGRNYAQVENNKRIIRSNRTFDDKVIRRNRTKTQINNNKNTKRAYKPAANTRSAQQAHRSTESSRRVIQQYNSNPSQSRATKSRSTSSNKNTKVTTNRRRI